MMAPRTASADGHDTEGPTPPDLGTLLVDVLASMADTLALHQDRLANESHLGSRATANRLRTAILRAPDVTLSRGPAPLVEGWILWDDED